MRELGRISRPLVVGLLAAGCGQNGAERDSGESTGGPLTMLVFSRTFGYRHASIPDGLAMLSTLGSERDWHVQATEEESRFTDEALAAFDVVVFLSTTGDVLGSDAQGALERFVMEGKGWVGIHSASDTEYDWPWYGGLVGAYFEAHPPTQPASIVVENHGHPATRGLPDEWQRTDEWYSFSSNPRANVKVLLALDESSYASEGFRMGDHPIAWFHEYSGGRAFYTALGHTPESYAEPLFREHVAGGIEWAAGR